jgi:hypothetical protein
LAGQPASAYQRALRQAEAACENDPNNGDHLNTLGVAQFRCGHHRDALATLRRSDLLHGGRRPTDLAFLAMTYHLLGDRGTARATLDRLRTLMQAPESDPSGQQRVFLHEAEKLILGTSPFPTDLDDIFAPVSPRRSS